MSEIYKLKRNSYLRNKSISSKLIIGVILLSIFMNFNDFNINFGVFDTTIQKSLLRDLDIEDYEENSNSFSILDNYNLPEFDSLEATKWRQNYLSFDRNQNGIHDSLEEKLNSLSDLSDTNKNDKLLSKQDLIEDLLGNIEIEKDRLTLDKISFIIQFPEGNYEELLSLFSDLGGKIDSTYAVAINGFAGSINHHGFTQFTELLNEAELPFFIEEDSIVNANLYFLSRNLNLRPYVWNNLTNTGDQYSSIAILDTGIDDSHPLFSPGYSSGNPNYKIVGWNDQVGSSSTPYDDNGHGTHCSGIATGDGTLTLDGNGRTVGTQSIGLDGTGFYTTPGYTDITGARFEVTQSGTIEIDCRFNDYTPGSDYIYLYAYLYHNEGVVDSYVTTSGSWSHTLSYVVTSGNEGDYSLRYRLYFADGNSDGYVEDPYLALRGIIHWPFNPLLLGGGEPWRGVAPDARLVGVKVLDGAGSGYESDIVAGINWIISNKILYNITTLSMSLGGSPGQTSLINAVNNAVENGIVVVVAAGNDGPGGNYVGSPGDAANVITVAASAYDDRVTSYSSQGSSSKPDILAPGGSYYNFTMFSADSGDSDADSEYTDGYPNDLASAQGTSMACPAVAGATNLMIEAMGGHQNWGYTAVEAKRVKAMLLMTATETYPLIREQSTATYSPLLNRGGRDAHEGYGRMNIDAAIEAYTNILNSGEQTSAILASSLVDPYNKHALGCYVNLVSGTTYKFKLNVPDGSDFDLHLYSNTPSSIGLPIMEASSISSALGSDENIEFTATTTGKYYLIAKAISGNGNATIKYLQNTYPPLLTNEKVTPKMGNQATIFNFSVTYTDIDDYNPSYINVIIDGTPYAMSKVDPSDDYYTDGCVYQYNTYLTPSVNNYTYSFECSDGTFTNSTISYNDVNVTEVNNFAPILTNGQVTPSFGLNSSTIFTFLVNYTDYDNTAPIYVNLILNSTIYSMNKQSTSDNYYIDGCMYTYSTILDDIGVYVFSFNTSDGIFEAGTGPFLGPTVEESNLKNYYMDVGYDYNWIDATGGTQLSLGDDGYSTQILPFDFTFYNETFSTIYVSANGYLSFTDSSPSNYNPPSLLPISGSSYTYLIAPFWDDLRTSAGGGGGTLYVQSFGTYWVIEWYNIQHYGGGTAGTFQVVLFESGEIIFNYDYISSVFSSTVCGLNLGVDLNYYNSYQGLSSSTNDFSIMFTYHGNDHAPVLSSGTVAPKEGNQLTPFTFSTIYTDADNNDPLYVNVSINGTSYPMQQQDPLDTDYTNGALFQYTTVLQSSDYNYSYSFECADRDFTSSTIVYSDLKVNLINNNAPILIDPQVSPTIGGYNTNFYFTVKYFDDDNNLPLFVNLIINNSMIYPMTPNPLDTNATDGIIYYYVSTMDFGYYQFLINCSDISFSNSTGWIDGPEVNPFYNVGPVSLLYPSSNTILFTGFNEFAWTSLNAPFGTYNYIFQISDVSDFSNIIYELNDVVETAGTTMVNISLNLPNGQYYWAVTPTYEQFSGVSSNPEVFTFNINEFEPELLDPSVNPRSGDQYSTFTFSITYYDQDNNTPQYVRVYIDGIYYTMLKLDPSDQNYIDGCVYQYQTSLAPLVSNYTYYFTCNDGRFSATTSVFNDLEVIQTNIYAPTLLNPYFSPNTPVTTPSTFTIYIDYYDTDNNLPQYVEISLKRGLYDFTNGIMAKVNPSDTNATDGIQYSYNIFLNYGNYSFLIYCSDGIFISTSGWINGPIVNPFGQYGIIFMDDFEDQILSPQWTVDGDAVINSATSNSGSYSLAISANGATGTNVYSSIIDLSGSNNLLLSMWICSGSSSFSEPPDSGENLYIYYYNNIGSWVLLGTILGSDSDPQIYTPNYILPSDAHHSNFRIRLYHNGGSMNPGDYYHVDDVMISGTESITLFYPTFSDTITEDPVTFIWSSLEASFGAVNYTLQISSTSDFSNIILNYNKIPETPVYTSINFTLNLQIGEYFWRIKPTYAGVSGPWSDVNTFSVSKPPIGEEPPILIIIFIIIISSIAAITVIISLGYIINRKSKKGHKKKEIAKTIPIKSKIPEMSTPITMSKSSELERLSIMKHEIQNEIPPPIQNDSPIGYKSLTIANSSLKLFKLGQEKKALELMQVALRMGVQEPENSILKRTALGIIDREINSINKEVVSSENKETQILICHNCQARLPPNVNFCTNCGFKIEESKQNLPSGQIQCPNCQAFMPLDVSFCTSCGKMMPKKGN